MLLRRVLKPNNQYWCFSYKLFVTIYSIYIYNIIVHWPIIGSYSIPRRSGKYSKPHYTNWNYVSEALLTRACLIDYLYFTGECVCVCECVFVYMSILKLVLRVSLAARLYAYIINEIEASIAMQYLFNAWGRNKERCSFEKTPSHWIAQNCRKKYIWCYFVFKFNTHLWKGINVA